MSRTNVARGKGREGKGREGKGREGSWLAPRAHDKENRIGFRKAKKAARNNIGIPKVYT